MIVRAQGAPRYRYDVQHHTLGMKIGRGKYGGISEALTIHFNGVGMQQVPVLSPHSFDAVTSLSRLYPPARSQSYSR